MMKKKKHNLREERAVERRIVLLWLLRTPKTVGEIAAMFGGISERMVSHMICMARRDQCNIQTMRQGKQKCKYKRVEA